MISSLEELALHQQHIEKIELLNQACRHLKILLLQNNLIPKLENLHRMKELQYLNVALNNITKVQNLQSCESLKKLDLTMNFVPKAGLLSVSSLNANKHFEELYLLGNPCADWHGYRDYVTATLPGLRRLDGQPIKPSERISAAQVRITEAAATDAAWRRDAPWTMEPLARVELYWLSIWVSMVISAENEIVARAAVHGTGS
jgi:protein TilB